LYTARGITPSGSLVSTSVIWSADAGNIDGQGRFTAPSDEGEYRITATHTVRTWLSDTAAVVVQSSSVSGPVATVELTPSSGTVSVGATVQFEAVAKNAVGAALPGTSFDWSSSDTDVAEVDTGGLVLGVGAGAAIITAAADGIEATAAVTVSSVPVASVEISPSSATLTEGETQQFTAIARDASGNELEGRVIAWSSDDEDVFTVDASGLVLAVGAGTGELTATSEGQAASVTIEVEEAAVAEVTVTPSSATLVSGQATTLNATVRDGDGNALTGRTVTWSSSNSQVASVNSNGRVTGGNSGTATITATSEGVSGTAQITVSVVPVAFVEVSPASASVSVGQSAQFQAIARDASGTELPNRVPTWSLSNDNIASINQSGLVTTQSQGTTTVRADIEGIEGTATLTIVASSPTNGVPDLSQLPIANGQQPNVTAWNALNVRNMAAGGSYADPLTGVRVWKITSASTPTSNSGMGHDYGDGPVQVSGEWGGNKHTILVRGDGYWLVDLERGVGLSNWRQVPNGARPGSDLNWTFSKNPATPQIAYSYSGGQLVRVNTGTNQVQNTGNFPKSMSSGYWLQQDKDDEWFVKMEGAGAVVAWNSVTNQTLRQSFSGLDEPHLEGNGRYVALITDGGTRVWDLQTNTVSSNGWGQWTFHHNASLLGHWISIHVDGPVFNFRLDPNGSSSPTGVNVFEPGMATYQHGAGQWVQRTVPVNQQYAVISSYGNLANGGEIWSGAKLKAAVGFLRSDGGDARILAHTYMVFNSGDYWQMPQATPSPDGKVVIFNSDMQNSNRYDLFLAEVPLQ
jgi:uncharacterized protein YjdB